MSWTANEAIAVQAVGYACSVGGAAGILWACRDFTARAPASICAAMAVAFGIVSVGIGATALEGVLARLAPTPIVVVGQGCAGVMPDGVAVATEEDMLPACARIDAHAVATSY